MALNHRDASPIPVGEWLQTQVVAGRPGEPVRLIIAGELERGTSDRLRRAIGGIVRDLAPETLWIDAFQVSFLDSSGIRALLICHGQARDAGTKLIIVNPAPLVVWVLQIAGQLETFGLPTAIASAQTANRKTTAATRARSPRPVPMPQLLAQSAAIRRDAQETRQRAEAMRHDDALRRMRMRRRVEPPTH